MERLFDAVTPLIFKTYREKSKKIEVNIKIAQIGIHFSGIIHITDFESDKENQE